MSFKGEDRFSLEATSALEEVTRGVALLAQVRLSFLIKPSSHYQLLSLTGRVSSYFCKGLKL